ncbi:hypothetical protein LMH87_002716 [Akanthomyces muscarius]|uniref:Hydrophobin n=1 Tax=Akanthomyces muscarius TaxID=2231603 RepID=A0A9W8UHA9_AKAMU|nr:hypothetical protein LMH87_002716 [Akanthomyces muscarius]KAJ4148236.1 hypothetical protein LMH87_002716 [Akanthomyces muscarius]
MQVSVAALALVASVTLAGKQCLSVGSDCHRTLPCCPGLRCIGTGNKTCRNVFAILRPLYGVLPWEFKLGRSTAGLIHGIPKSYK